MPPPSATAADGGADEVAASMARLEAEMERASTPAARPAARRMVAGIAMALAYVGILAIAGIFILRAVNAIGDRSVASHASPPVAQGASVASAANAAARTDDDGAGAVATPAAAAGSDAAPTSAPDSPA